MQEKNSSLVSILNPFHVFFFNQRPLDHQKSSVHAVRHEVSQFGEAARKTVEEEVANFLAQGSDPSGSPCVEGRCWNFVGGGFVE